MDIEWQHNWRRGRRLGPQREFSLLFNECTIPGTGLTGDFSHPQWHQHPTIISTNRLSSLILILLLWHSYSDSPLCRSVFAHAMDAFYWLFSRKKQRARHRWAQSVYPTASLFKIVFLCLVCQSLWRLLYHQKYLMVHFMFCTPL